MKTCKTKKFKKKLRYNKHKQVGVKSSIDEKKRISIKKK